MHPTITPEYLKAQGLSPTIPERFWSYVDKNGPVPKHMPHLGNCWIWTGKIGPSGYGLLTRNTLGTLFIRSHRVAWMIQSGPIPSGLCVLHHCDCRRCCRFDHLFIGTRKDNAHDMINKGRSKLCTSMPREKNGRCVLTENQVSAIRSRYSAGNIKQSDLGREFGIAQTTVSAIIRKLIWPD